MAKHLFRHRPPAENAGPPGEEYTLPVPGQRLPEGVAEGSVLTQRVPYEPLVMAARDQERYLLTSSRFFPSFSSFCSSASRRSRRASTMSSGAFAMNFWFSS